MAKASKNVENDVEAEPTPRGPDDPWWPDIVTLQTQIDAINTSLTSMNARMDQMNMDSQLIWQHITGIEDISILQAHVRSVYANVRPGPSTEVLETEMVTDALEKE